MKTAISILLSISGVIFPFMFIGSAYFVIPHFQEIYIDMTGVSTLPRLTEIIVNIPRYMWLLIAGIFVAVNCYNSIKLKKAILAIFSASAMILITGFIVVGLFLPIQETIKKLDDSAPISEPDGSGQ